MKKFISLLCFLVILTAGSAASAITTTQIWYFGTDQVMPVPDVVDNTYGIPQLKVDKGSGAGWQSSAGGRTGIWSLSGEIDVLIPNYQFENPYKEITINLTWAPGGVDPFLPDQPLVGVSAIPMDSMKMSVVNDPIAGTIWTQSIYSIVIWPNPPREWIAIKGDILVDELDIKTTCVPEPAPMGLLGLGGLARRRVRRKH
jgi:MYXO-CTERM domain-containing protein